jgi:hypothetical protein
MSRRWSTYTEIAEVAAAALRVMLLDNEKSGLDRAEPYVRTRVEDAVRVLEECADRLHALESFYLKVGDLGSEVLDTLCDLEPEGAEG